MFFLDKILEWDKQLLLYLNGFHNDYWDTIMLLITRKETWLPLFAVILYYIIKVYRGKALIVVLFLAVLITASDQLSVLMKNSFERLRPVYEPSISHLVHNVLRKGAQFGFVSSHAANSVALLVFTFRLFKRRSYYFLMLAWAVLFCYSRIYAGVHYPLDIAGGALLGWGIGALVYKLMVALEKRFFFSRRLQIGNTPLRRKQAQRIWLVFAVLLSTVFIVTGLLHHYNYL